MLRFDQAMHFLFLFKPFYFARYKKYMICLILFSRFSDVLPAFACARAIGNLWSIWLGANVLRLKWSETLLEQPVLLMIIGNILLSED